MDSWVVSIVLIKNQGAGSINIQNALYIVDNVAEETAVGRITLLVKKELPEHHIFSIMTLKIDASEMKGVKYDA